MGMTTGVQAARIPAANQGISHRRIAPGTAGPWIVDSKGRSVVRLEPERPLGIIAAPVRSTRARNHRGSLPMASTPAAPPPPETVEVDQINVSCEGNGGPLGHPRVFLSLEKGEVECPYCDRRFVLRAGAPAGGH
jgi:uncharacterized Zn-finger protein